MKFDYTVKLIKKEKVAKNVLHFKFSRPENFEFTAGQFIQFLIPTNDQVVKRAYSIASVPIDNYLGFYIKLLDGGKASTFFDNIEVGYELIMSNAVGSLVVDEKIDNHYFIATGTGLVPLISIIKDELENNKNKSNFHLLFGLRLETDIFMKEVLDRLSNEYDNFTYQIALSDESGHWNGLRGRVTNHITKDVEGKTFYLCGNLPMSKSTIDILIGRGVNIKDIRFEAY